MPALMESVNLEQDITWQCIDTMALARKAFPGAPNFKLQTLVDYLNIKTDGAHRARADALATVELFELCRNALIQKTGFAYATPVFYAIISFPTPGRVPFDTLPLPAERTCGIGRRRRVSACARIPI